MKSNIILSLDYKLAVCKNSKGEYNLFIYKDNRPTYHYNCVGEDRLYIYVDELIYRSYHTECIWGIDIPEGISFTNDDRLDHKEEEQVILSFDKHIVNTNKILTNNTYPIYCTSFVDFFNDVLNKYIFNL